MGGGLAAVIRSGITAWKAATAGAQGVVTLEAWIGEDSKGEADFADPVPLSALIQANPARQETASGDEQKVLAIVTFLEALPANGAAGRVDEPIDPRDRITLPDGRTGPITDVKGGWVDPGTNLPFMAQVTLGRG